MHSVSLGITVPECKSSAVVAKPNQVTQILTPPSKEVSAVHKELTRRNADFIEIYELDEQK